MPGDKDWHSIKMTIQSTFTVYSLGWQAMSLMNGCGEKLKYRWNIMVGSSWGLP